jgi:hypothetical protein
MGTVGGETSGVIVNRNGTLNVRQSTFVETKDQSKEVRINKEWNTCIDCAIKCVDLTCFR